MQGQQTLETVIANEADNIVFNNNLSTNPIYGIYNSLITDGIANVDTSIFTSMEIIDSHFMAITNLFRDGIELDSIQASKVRVTFVNGPTVNLSIMDYWFNLIFWGLPAAVGDPITVRFLFFEEAITKKSIKKYIDFNFIDIHRTDYDDIRLNNIIDQSIHKFMYIDNFSFFLMNTSNNEDTIELMEKSKAAYDAIHCDLSEVPTEEIKNAGTVQTDILINEMIKSKTHWARPYFMSGEGINRKQFREFLVNIGTVPDGEGSIFPYPLNGNYANGACHKINYYIIDAAKARTSQELAKMNVGRAGDFARKEGLNNMDTKLHPDPKYICDTKNFIPLTILNGKMLSVLKHRYYRLYPNGIEFYMGANPTVSHADLIGKTIYLRSPITCASGARGEGICYRCYGNLAHTNNGLNVGKFAAEELSSQLTQRLLSAKHLLESAVQKTEWVGPFDSYFDIDFGMITVAKDFNEKKYKLEINKDEIEQDEEYDQDEYNDYILSFSVIDPVGNANPIHTVDSENIYITPALLEMINRKKADVDGNIYFDFAEIRDMELFKVSVTNNGLALTLDRIKALLNKKSEVESFKTIQDWLSAVLTTVSDGGLTMDSVHLEVLLSNQVVRPESNLLKCQWEYPNEPYRMITLNEALKDNPSVAISLMYEKVKEQLRNPITFQKTKPSSIDLFYMVQPQNYMNEEFSESNVIPDNNEGLIKPFTMKVPE